MRTSAPVRAISGLALFLLTAPSMAQAPVNILTQHNDNARTGANLNETVLNTSNVNANQFGRLFTRDLDGYPYAQILYVSQLKFPDGSTHNVIYVATEHNSVYCYDADDPNAAMPLWQVNLGPSVPARDFADWCADLVPEVGITSTPVIDLATGTLYVEAETEEQSQFFHKIHALDILTGAEKLGGPRMVTATVDGTGDGSVNGKVVFDPKTHFNRPGLLLQKNVKVGNMMRDVLYVGYGSHCDIRPYHGWVMAYDAKTLDPLGVYCTTPNGWGGSPWQSGMGLTADGNNDVYFLTGNGTTDISPAGVNLATALVKVGFDATGNFVKKDWFIPSNQQYINDTDQDLGSSGMMIIPGTDTVIGGGKEGAIYVVKQANLGKFVAGDTQIVQKYAVTDAPFWHIHGSPVYWNGPSGQQIYVWPENDSAKAIKFDGTKFMTPIASRSTFKAPPGMPGGFLTISANGATPGSGVLWALRPINRNANQSTVPGILHAFDASDLTKELYNSLQYQAPDANGNIHSLDDLGDFAKYAAPTVANGKVYVPSFSGLLAVYGLLRNTEGTPPAVRITGPADGAMYLTGSDVTLSAQPFSRGSTVVQVDFMDGDSYIDSAMAPPYSVTYYAPAVGAHNIYALVTDANGQVSQSRAIKVQIAAKLAVRAGGGAVGDFAADSFFIGGNSAGRNNKIDLNNQRDPAPEAVYQTERWGEFSYIFPNLKPGNKFKVRLHFAEIVFNNANARVFDVDINGVNRLRLYDPWKAAGGINKAKIEEWDDIVADADGKITVRFYKGAGAIDNPKVSGLEVIPVP